MWMVVDTGGGAGQKEIGLPDVSGLISASCHHQEIREICGTRIETDGVDGTRVTAILQETTSRLYAPNSGRLICKERQRTLTLHPFSAKPVRNSLVIIYS